MVFLCRPQENHIMVISNPNFRRPAQSNSLTRTFFFLSRVLLSVWMSFCDLEIGTATNAQSCFSSILPSSPLLKLPILKNKPAISPLDILSLRPPEMNRVVHFDRGGNGLSASVSVGIDDIGRTITIHTCRTSIAMDKLFFL